jgi:hypothetical protein
MFSLEPEHIAVPHRRFSHLHIDLVGPLPKSFGCTHLFTIVDLTTRWPEAVPVSSTTAADCAAALFSGWVQRFGLPAAITSDRGPQFTSALWAALCKLLGGKIAINVIRGPHKTIHHESVGIAHISTTSYHPQSNGLVERFHRHLKDALQARAAGQDWVSHLPWVMLGIRSAWREGTTFSPAESVSGAQPVLLGQFLAAEEDPPSPSFFTDLLAVLSGRTVFLPPQHHSTLAPQQLPEELLLTKHVLIRKDGHVPPLAASYDGPYLVLKRSLRYFKLQVGGTFSTIRRKPCRSPPDVQVAQPPKRGWPPVATTLTNTGDPSAPVAAPPPRRHRRRRVTFSCPVVTIPTSPQQRLHPSGRPARSAGPPRRYIISLAHLRRPRLEGGGGVVARRPLTTVLYISIFSLFVYSRHIFITQPLAYCLHKKCINIFTLYCTLMCVISRDFIPLYLMFL